MRFRCLLLVCLAGFTCLGAAQEPYARLEKAVERSTLAQPGTKPFHLKAVLETSRPASGDSTGTGSVEYWWDSPTHYRRELRSSSFHQVEIVYGDKIWQHNDGDYLPFWLDAIAQKLIEPVPSSELARAKTAEIRQLMGTTYFEWADLSSNGTVQKGMGVSVELNNSTGLLRLDSNWKEKYQDFHGLKIAQSITAGSPEVRASVVVLEDLGPTARELLDAAQAGGDAHLIRMVKMDELSVRQNLLPSSPPVWPILRDGPLGGVLTVHLILDRTGHPRDCARPISDNPGIDETAQNYICGLQFRPILVEGEAVEVTTRFTMPFKTARPTGTEIFDSARAYFERGRRAGFPAAASSPYLMRAEFQTKGTSGAVETGRYEDTFVDEQHWRREAWFGRSHAVRSQNGKKRYRLDEGPQAGLLGLVFRITEPIPAIDTFVESDWRINRTIENGQPAIRVLSGYESPDGKLDPEHSRAYWFASSGQLIKTYSSELETRRSNFQSFAGIDVARTVNLYSHGSLALKLAVTQLSPGPGGSPPQLVIPGHDWTRQFTDEVR